MFGLSEQNNLNWEQQMQSTCKQTILPHNTQQELNFSLHKRSTLSHYHLSFATSKFYLFTFLHGIQLLSPEAFRFLLFRFGLTSIVTQINNLSLDFD
jgi:hypothetical protein